MGQIEAASANMRGLRPRPDPKGLAFLGALRTTEQTVASNAEVQAQRLLHDQVCRRAPPRTPAPRASLCWARHRIGSPRAAADVRSQLEQKRPESLFGKSIDRLSSAVDQAARRDAQEKGRQRQQDFILEEQRSAEQRSMEEGAAMQRENLPPSQQEYAKVLGALQAVAAKSRTGGKQRWGQEAGG